MGDSIWKKEISFRKKGGETEPTAAKPPKAKGEPFWKKEISIGKKRVAPPAAPVAEPAPQEELALTPPPPEQYSWLTASLEEQAAPPAVAPAAPAPLAPAPVAPMPVPPAQPGAMPAIQVALPTVPAAQPVAVAPPPVAPAPIAPPPAPVAPAPVAPMPVPVAPPPAPIAPQPAPVAQPLHLAQPVPVAQPAPVAQPVPVPPPVPVAPRVPVAPPPVVGAMPAIPYTPPPAVPVAAPVPAQVAIEAVLPIAPEPHAPSVPDPTPTQGPEREQKVPFWKKEIGGKRKPKAEKQPKPMKEKKEKKEKGESVPFWKKEIGGKKTPEAEKAPKAKGAKTPFWKLELGGKKKKKDADFDTPKAAKQKAAKGPKPAKTLAKSSVVGLKIGASQIAAARVQNGEEPQLVQVARETLDEGIVVGGELRDFEALAATLKEFFAKHKLPKKGVRLGIANNRIGVRTFDIAGIEDAKQLANAIRFRAQETLPIPLEEAALDWQVLSETTDPETGQTTRRVLLVVAYRELVDRYIAACKKAGIRLAGIDLEAFALLRALNAPLSADAPPAVGAQVVVNVGHDRSTFAVSDGRVCEFTRVLAWGGSSFAVAIARALDVTPSEATPLLHALSLVAETETPEGFTPEAVGAAREAVRRELQSFARELVSSLRFYQNQPASLGIGGLVLTGGTAHLPGFTAELERLIGVPVTVGDPLARVRLPKKFKEPERVGSLSVAIGLGIED